MKLSADKIKKISKNNSLDLKLLLEKAGISKTAYYSLIKKESVLPKSILALANVLNVSPSKLLVDQNKIILKTIERKKKLQKILQKHPECDPDNVWHTLILLEEKPIERLRRSLTRARKFNFQ